MWQDPLSTNNNVQGPIATRKWSALHLLGLGSTLVNTELRGSCSHRTWDANQVVLGFSDLLLPFLTAQFLKCFLMLRLAKEG